MPQKFHAPPNLDSLVLIEGAGALNPQNGTGASGTFPSPTSYVYPRACWKSSAGPPDSRVAQPVARVCPVFPRGAAACGTGGTRLPSIDIGRVFGKVGDECGVARR